MKITNVPTEFGRTLLLEPTRRHFFQQCGLGLGKIALASLLTQGFRPGRARGAAPFAAPENELAPRSPHYAAKAKRVIYLFMAGGPSQFELFDDKPVLRQYAGKPVPEDVVRDQRYAFIRRDAMLLAPRFRFHRHGESGRELSEVLPHLAQVIDDIAIVKSLHTDQFNHAPAQIFLNTGSPRPGRPSMGSWVSYGLGCDADDLPAFVVLSSGGGTSGGAANWSNGFLATTYQGVPFRTQGSPILNVGNPTGVDAGLQRDSLDLIRTLNAKRFSLIGDPAIAARIGAYEMAYRMQTRAPELMDLNSEGARTLRMYGISDHQGASYARNCLLARRLIERGVRFVSIYHNGWDHHTDVENGIKKECGTTDQATAALIMDLKQRGLLDDTLVVWGGEFGRTPMVESNVSLGRKLGRDHHPQSFTVWLAGGGIKPGMTIGATDDIGFHIVEDPIHIHDLQATILHLLGLNHERLTFSFQGREFRLTDVHGNVVKKLLA